jgi:hypothetical protein
MSERRLDMTSLGLHYFPDESHYRAVDLQAWLPELRALGAKWLTLVGSLTRAVPEPFIRGLIEAGIAPLVHIPATPIRAADIPGLLPLLKTYARWGVQYVVIFSEPNSRAVWPPSEWGKTALVERFLDVLIPVLHAQAEAGLQPAFPPLKAGGEYWDTGFLEAALAGMARRGQSDLAQRLTFATNLWTFNRPTDWGAGGLKRWPEAKPYLTPPGSQDQRGFRVFDWHTEIIADRLGEPRPIICLAGGPRLGDKTDPAFPPVDEARHTTCTQEIAQAAEGGALPAHLLNVNFWLIGAPEGSPFAPEAWYRSDGSTLAAVDALKRRAAAQGQSPQRANGKSFGPDQPKAIHHYLLLPTFEWGVSEWHWRAALEFVKAHRPVCGFSPEEAALAQRVTIFGNEQGVSREVETGLRSAGCWVERIQVKGRE